MSTYCLPLEKEQRPVGIVLVRLGTFNHCSYLSRLGVTPRISQDERSSVTAHESTPSVSMIIALEHRSRVKRTSFKLRESGERSSLQQIWMCEHTAASLSTNYSTYFILTSLYLRRKREQHVKIFFFSYFTVALHIKAMPTSVSHPDVICQLEDQGPRTVINFQTRCPANQFWGNRKFRINRSCLPPPTSQDAVYIHVCPKCHHFQIDL